MLCSSILQEISSELDYVEKELHRYALSSQTLLGESSESLVEAGGKKLRPAFVLLSGKFFHNKMQLLCQLAVAVELIHMGTLVHDDVIDNAATRRGRPTVRVQWGDSIALQTGDYLFAQALRIVAQYGNQEILRILSQVSLEIWEQTKGKITHFVAGMGTTGTLMGCSRRLKEFNPNIKIIGVEPFKCHNIQGLKNMEEAIVPKLYNPALLDEKVGIIDEDAFVMTRRLAREEGIFSGMSSGAAFHVAVELSKKLDEGLIVTLFPDRGEKYLSTPLYRSCPCESPEPLGTQK
jgi:hypothetical protein